MHISIKWICSHLNDVEVPALTKGECWEIKKQSNKLENIMSVHIHVCIHTSLHLTMVTSGGGNTSFFFPFTLNGSMLFDCLTMNMPTVANIDNFFALVHGQKCTAK